VLEHFGAVTLATALWITIFVGMALSPAIAPTGAAWSPPIPRAFAHRNSPPQVVAAHSNAVAPDRFE
jgi:hypothetical protein